MFEDKKINRKDILYPKLSYDVIGCAFDVYNEIGPGYHEKYYQRAMAEALKNKKIIFSEQVYTPLKYSGAVIGKQYLDFLIDGIIVVELKKGNVFSKRHIDQVVNYLKTKNLQLALLINFTNNGVVSKRIVNVINS
ncbi:MAG: GxxExxY protein [Candidatus Staskawiczbacteria bacterium]|nr:GxxExxY protein [Candidatus Staskawiczbacteria bacterium]